MKARLNQIFFLVFICLRHGINPFLKMWANEKKFRKRLSEKEKQWIIAHCHESGQDYFKKMLYENK